MSSLEISGREWERNARTNALWAVLTDRDRTVADWNVEEFFATGRSEIDAVMSRLRILKACPNPRGVFVDFGCGVGRVSRPLMEHFAAGYGIDISPTMVERAKEYASRDDRRPSYIVNTRDDLKIVPTSSVDFVYSHIVLQHLPSRLQPRFVEEFLRILRPGGVAAFQIPTADLSTQLAKRLKSVKRALRALLSPDAVRFLKMILGRKDAVAGVAMDMNVLAENEVRAIIVRNGCTLLAAPFTNSTDTSHRGRIFFMTREEALRQVALGETDSMFLSQFFFVRKN